MATDRRRLAGPPLLSAAHADRAGGDVPIATVSTFGTGTLQNSRFDRLDRRTRRRTAGGNVAPARLAVKIQSAGATITLVSRSSFRFPPRREMHLNGFSRRPATRLFRRGSKTLGFAFVCLRSIGRKCLAL
jgi:hypothetical protein